MKLIDPLQMSKDKLYLTYERKKLINDATRLLVLSDCSVIKHSSHEGIAGRCLDNTYSCLRSKIFDYSERIYVKTYVHLDNVIVFELTNDEADAILITTI